MVDPDGIELFKQAATISHNIAYFLPKNTPIDSMVILADTLQSGARRCKIEGVVYKKRLKAITAYYGDLA